MTQKPTFIYLIKEMCETLADRIELDAPLGEGKIVRERQAEQRALYRKDEADLFPGLFTERTQGRNFTHRGRVYDREDHVIRCSSCQWELEDIYECVQCGVPFDDLIEDDPQDREFLDAIGPLASALGWHPDGIMDGEPFEDEYGDEGDEDEDEEDIEGDDDGRPNVYDLDDSFVDDRPTSDLELTQGDGTFFDETETTDDAPSDGLTDIGSDGDDILPSAAPASRRGALDTQQIRADDELFEALSSSYPGPTDEDMADYAFDQMDEHVPEDDSDHSRPPTMVCHNNATSMAGRTAPSNVYDLTTDSPEQINRATNRRAQPRTTTTTRGGRIRAPRIFIDSDDGE